MSATENFTPTSQASGPERFQLHLLAKIRERLARAQHHLVTHSPGDVVGLIDEAGAFFHTLSVVVPRPSPMLTYSADVPQPEREEPLPRWIADKGNRHE